MRRLLSTAEALGVWTAGERRLALNRLEREDALMSFAKTTSIDGSRFGERSGAAGTHRVADWAKRHELPLAEVLAAAGAECREVDDVHWVDVELKYAGYIARERRSAARLAGMDGLQLPEEIGYRSIDGLSKEAVEKLDRVRPTTLAQAAQVPGITAADLHRLAHAVAKGRVSRETGSRAGLE